MDAAGGGATSRRVLLVCLPYQGLSVSSLATAHLATFLREHGVDCAELYLHFELARLLGRERYQEIVRGPPALHGELLFAEGLHGELGAPEADASLTRTFGGRAERRELLAQLERVAGERLAAAAPELVGMSTSCNQLLPALWLARLVKRVAPKAEIVLGGAACAEPMGQRLLAAYPEVDRVVAGYGELPLLALARGEAPPGRLLRSDEPLELDSLPIPDYGPFLRAAEDFGADDRLALTFESSRGCWWGQKRPCTFCGLNGPSAAFRAKSSARVVREVRALWDRYQRHLFATDTIMPRTHVAEVMPALAAFASRPRLFYEIKVNLTQADVVALARGGMYGLQPGIESLSTRLLTLLGKGTTTIRNLALLKWCRERRLAVSWNQLCGIPGEEVADYDEQIALMRRVPHLAPPHRVNPIRIDRYSRYFDAYREYGWTELEPFAEYRWLHPQLDADALRDLAYHFHGRGGVATEAYQERFAAALGEWQRRHARGEGLFLHPTEGLIRNDGTQGFRFRTNAMLDRVLACTHDITPIAQVLDHAGCHRSVLDQLVDQGFVYLEGDAALNLVVRLELPA